MRLFVAYPDGAKVAEVVVDASCPFAQNPGEPPGFVIGRFDVGPAFTRVRARLQEFQDAHERGDLVLAASIHAAIDALGLVATDELGRAYRVFNVYFQQGALLFTAVL